LTLSTFHNFSAAFKNLGHAVTTLVVHGYLKPDKLKKEVTTSEVGFLKFYHILYLVLASAVIVNFLITIITEVNAKTKWKRDRTDILAYLISKAKIRKRQNRSVRRIRKMLKDVYFMEQNVRKSTTVDEILLNDTRYNL